MTTRLAEVVLEIEPHLPRVVVGQQVADRLTLEDGGGRTCDTVGFGPAQPAPKPPPGRLGVGRRFPTDPSWSTSNQHRGSRWASRQPHGGTSYVAVSLRPSSSTRERTLILSNGSLFTMTFTAVITRDEGGWYIAQCRELPGVVTQGRTLNQVRSRFSEALEGHLETLAELRSKHGRPSRNQVVVGTFQYEVSATPV